MNPGPVARRLASIGLAALTALVAACAPGSADAEAARRTLVDFFDRLADKEYAEAAALYGGDYEQLMVFNPDVDPADTPSLWRRACEQSGLQCLQIESAAWKERIDNTYTFSVGFKYPDGRLFVLGPCCGADATEMPPTSRFDYRVRKTSDGAFLVLDLPVYVP